MQDKEHQLKQLLELKYQRAQAKVTEARSACLKIEEQIATVQARRNVHPTDPGDQINHERHIGWLDQRNRELTISAAQAAAEFNIAKDMLRIEFGRKAALSKAMERLAKEKAQKASRQLS